MNDTILFVVKFKISGTLRFLSHAEMLRVFQRACVRASIHVRHSEGFNPRPKLSLPLPRPVGVESDNELLCLHVIGEADPDGQQDEIRESLAAQLPEGCELLSVTIARDGASFEPCAATYVLQVKPECMNQKLQTTVERLLVSENLPILRRMDARGIRTKNINVRGFLKSIQLENQDIIVECSISPAGSIRMDEILELLGLDESELTGPVRRMNVRWVSN